MKKLNACKICNNSNNNKLTHLFIAKDPENGTSYHINQCLNCGTIYTENENLDIEKSYYVNYRKYTGIANLILDIISLFNVSKWLRKFPDTRNVLEIGSGNGKMLKFFSNKGKYVLGTEMNKKIADEIKANTGLNIIPEYDLVNSKIKFDLIFLYHVLEHLVNPNQILDRLKKLLNVDGTIIITVPNTDSFQYKLFKKNWVHLDPPRHLFHFNFDSFKFLMNSNNLTVVASKSSSTFYDFYGWFESILNSIFKEKNTINKIFRKKNNFNLKLLVKILFIICLLPIITLIYFISLLFCRSAITEYHVKTNEN
jgi:SAM-dependent methyltransferase